MRKMMVGVAFAAALALCGGSALAVDQLITGKKVLIVNPVSGAVNNKIVYLSKDPALVNPGSVAEDPRCIPDGGSGAGGVLVVAGTPSGEGFSISLPCANWSVNTAGNQYKYKDTTGGTCKIAIIKGGKLQKAVCKGTQVSYDLGTADTNVAVKVRTGTTPRQWCTAFNTTTEGCELKKDGSDDKKLLYKNCTSGPSGCPASPSGAFIELAGLF